MLDLREPNHATVFETTEPDPRPKVIPFTNIFPSVAILIRSTLFVRRTRGILSVVQRKLVEAFVPAFPTRLHSVALAGALAQRAVPSAAEVRTFPSPGVHPRIRIWPSISSFVLGLEVPTPIFHPFP